MILREDAVGSLREYAAVPIAFVVRARASVDDLPRIVEIPVEPWTKDYDAVESPSRWAETFEVSNWTALSAWFDGERIGGAVVARDTPGVRMLRGRSDLAVLWDIRVAPDWRGKGVGRRLFEAAVALARRHGCVEFEVETQDINVPACRFYSAMGCTVASVDPDAYPGLDETQIVWGLKIGD